MRTSRRFSWASRATRKEGTVDLACLRSASAWATSRSSATPTRRRTSTNSRRCVSVSMSCCAEAADAYLQIREFQARLTVAQQLIDTDTHLLELVEVRRRVGVADDREVAQAEALLKQAKSTVPSLRVALEAQLNRLDVLMGAQPGTYAEELSKPGAIPGIPAITGADQPLDVLRRRPELI